MIYGGAGFVGACAAAVSAESGHDVLAHDIYKEKVLIYLREILNVS